jgi:hypothetical protein
MKKHFEGCTPGFWKNHYSVWYETEYRRWHKVSSVFSNAGGSLGKSSLSQALGFKGGSTLYGAKQILLRAAVAAILNADHPDVKYYRSEYSIKKAVNAALKSYSRWDILYLATVLDKHNNDGCPLDGKKGGW